VPLGHWLVGTSHEAREGPAHGIPARHAHHNSNMATPPSDKRKEVVGYPFYGMEPGSAWTTGQHTRFAGDFFLRTDCYRETKENRSTEGKGICV